MIAYSSIREECLGAEVGTDGCSIITLLSIHATQRVPCHGGAVAFPILIVMVGGVADDGVGGERYVALVVGLRAQDGIERTGLATERGEGDAVECEAHKLGRIVELGL